MELKLDQWATTPPAGYPGAIPPPPGKRVAGFTNGEEAPAGYFNHAWDALADTQNELVNLITGAGLTSSESDLSQVLRAINKLITRRAELAGITQWVDLAPPGAQYTTLSIAAGSLSVVAVGNAPYRISSFAARNHEWEIPSPDASYSGQFNDVCWSAAFNRFVAVGRTGEIQDSVDTTDGALTWLRRATGGSDWRACAAGPAAVVVVGDSGAIKSTVDGTTYTSRTTAYSGLAMYGVAYSPSLNVFAAVGSGGMMQRGNSTGTTWTPMLSSAFGSANVIGVTWSSEYAMFFAWNTAGAVLKSSDGLTWTMAISAVDFVTGTIGAVVALPEHLVVMSKHIDCTYVKLYRVDALNGSPAAVATFNILPSADNETCYRLIRVPAGLAFAGRLLLACENARIRVSHFLG